MAGIEKGSTQWTQMAIGRITNDIRKIHENHPEADEDLKKLMKDVGHYIDGTLDSEHEPERSIADVWIEKIFS